MEDLNCTGENCIFYSKRSDNHGYCTSKFKEVKTKKTINMKMNDSSRMPFGKYKGEKMANVPASYLMWLYDENKCNKEVRNYIEDNLNVLQEEIKRVKQ